MPKNYKSVVMSTTKITKFAKPVMQRFPKVELHRHLEGAFSLTTLYRIAQKNGLVDSGDDFSTFKADVQFPRDSEPDFLKFLSKFKNHWYRTRDDVYEITHDSVLEFADDGLFYLELRFSPEHFAMHNGFDRGEITRLVIDAANTAAAKSGILLRYIITFNRAKQNQREMLALYRDILALNIPDIVGIDLAGDETQYPPEDFEDFFTAVHKSGVHKATIHAGEVSSASQVWLAIEKLHASRIGHGTASVDDPRLQRLLIDSGIVLEQCLTSNYQTGSWVDERNHPIGRLYEWGVPVTINSDDPTIQDTDLTDDYLKVQEYFKLGIEDLVKLNLTAIEGAFLQDSDKADLKTRYLDAVASFRSEQRL